MIISWIAEKLLNVCGHPRCPRCGSADVKSKRVRRTRGQRDGLDGYSYTCGKCSFTWVKPIVPMI